MGGEQDEEEDQTRLAAGESQDNRGARKACLNIYSLAWTRSNKLRGEYRASRGELILNQVGKMMLEREEEEQQENTQDKQAN